MANAKRVVASSRDLVRRFEHYSEIASDVPVVVTRNGRPRNVLLSVEEYKRLKQRDQRAFLAGETPARFLTAIERLAGGNDR